MDKILRGYTSQATAYEVKNYPYGYTLRTSIFYWIETKPNLGDRVGTYTINPKTGKPNKPKYSTYSPFKYLYLDDNNYVRVGSISAYDIEEFKLRFGFITNKIGEVYITEDQKTNIRFDYLANLLANYPYMAVKYSDKMRPVYAEWIKVVKKHILTCPFAELVDHPEAPEVDNPNGEVKFFIQKLEACKLPQHENIVAPGKAAV